MESTTTADAAAMESTIAAAGALAAAEARVAMKPALRPTGYRITVKARVAAEASLRPGSISVEALETLAAAESCRAVEVPGRLKAMKARSASDCSAMEALPPAAANRVIAPVPAVMEIPPAAAIVEIDPCSVVEVDKSSAKRRPVEPVKPRPRANKHAAHKPLRPIITIRRASVRRVRIIAIRAYRRRSKVGWGNNCRSHPHANRHANTRARRPRRCSGECHHQAHDCRVL
jgi:hypothetical protein